MQHGDSCGFYATLPATLDNACNCVPSVESIKLMTIVEAKMGQNGRRLKCAQLFNKSSALSGLKSNNNLYRL